MKKSKFLILLLSLCLIILSAILIYQQKEISNLKSDIQSFVDLNSQKDVTDDFSIQITEINSKLNNEILGIVYFGRDTCPICTELNSIIIENIDFCSIKIYKFDTDKWRNNDKFQTVLDKYDITKIPTLIKINDDNTYMHYIPDENLSDEELIISLHKFLKS